MRTSEIERNSHSKGNFWKKGETTQAGVVSDLNTGGTELSLGLVMIFLRTMPAFLGNSRPPASLHSWLEEKSSRWDRCP